MYPTLTNFNQTKRKTYDANDILALSLDSIIVSIYYHGKSFIVYISKTTEHEMLLSYAKFLPRECTNNL